MKFCALFLSDAEAIIRLWFGTHTCGDTVSENTDAQGHAMRELEMAPSGCRMLCIYATIR